MRQKLPGENTSTVTRHSYKRKHGKEKTAVEKGKHDKILKNGNIPVQKDEKVRLYFKKVKYNRTRKERYRGIPLKLDLDKKAG